MIVLCVVWVMYDSAVCVGVIVLCVVWVKYDSAVCDSAVCVVGDV